MKIPLSQIALPAHDLRADIDDDKIDELAASMREHGQLQAIGVKKIGEYLFEVVYGARRTRAAFINKWTEINAEVVEHDENSDPNAKKLIENVQRESLTPIEEAYGLFALIGEAEVSISKLKAQTGKSREWIKSRLELLDLPEDLQGFIQQNLLSVVVAKILGRISNEQIRLQYIEYAIVNGCTAQQATIWAGQAEYAETGMLSMIESEAARERITEEPQFIRQLYNCFGCGEKKDFMKVNTLVICGECQERIRPQVSAPKSRSDLLPIDNDDIMRT